MKNDEHEDHGHPEGHRGHHGGGMPHARGHHHRRKGHPGRLFDYGELRLLFLAMIAQRPRHGYELIKDISDRFGGSYSPSPGVVYPTLAWLDDMGYVAIAAEGGGRKLSRITPEGEAFLVANRAAADEILTRKAKPGRPAHIPPDIERAFDAVKKALRGRLDLDAPGTATETPETAAIAAILLDAARRIESKG